MARLHGVPAMMLRFFGFDLSNDVVAWGLALVGFASIGLSWICDAVMREHGFGIFGNAVVLFGGAVAALVCWQAWVQPWSVTDPGLLFGVGLIASMALLYGAAAARKFAP